MKMLFGIAMVAIFAAPFISAQFVILSDLVSQMAAIVDSLSIAR